MKLLLLNDFLLVGVHFYFHFHFIKGKPIPPSPSASPFLPFFLILVLRRGSW